MDIPPKLYTPNSVRRLPAAACTDDDSRNHDQMSCTIFRGKMIILSMQRAASFVAALSLINSPGSQVKNHICLAIAVIHITEVVYR